MAMFTGFKPQGMQKIANRLGYSGDMVNFDNYLQQNPEKQRQMIVYEDAARKMAEGGYVNMQTGGTPSRFQRYPTETLNYIQNKPDDYTEYEINQVKNILNQRNNPTQQTASEPIMTSPGFNPMYEGRNAQDYGQQNRIPTFDYLYGQTPPPSLGGTSEPFYRPKPGETLYRTDQAAMAENPNYPGFIARTAVEPRQGGQYAMTSTGDRVTVPLGFFGTAPGGNRFQAAIDQRTAPQLVDPRDIASPLSTITPIFNYTYEQALSRQAQRDVKSPEEAKAIADAIARGPSIPVDPRDAVAPALQTTVAQQIPATQGTDRQQAYVPTTGTGEGQIPVFGTQTNPQNITDATALRAQTGALPVGAVTQPELTPFEQSQLIDTSTGMGQANVISATGQAGLAQAGQTGAIPAAQVTPVVAQEAVQNALATNQAAQTDVSDKAQILAAQATASSVANLNAAQGNAILMASPSQRAIREGELVDSVTNAETAKTFTEQVQAATATASDQATVAGQLATLTTNFDATNPPAWASGAIRGVQAVMQQRGLGASSIAGQALVQAAMESALPIAQADANTVRTFELQNLSNRQQRAMLAAQQRASFIGQEFDQQFQARVQNAAKISDVANRNFTADQQIQLENSRIANTLNLQNLTNRQALVLAEASALTGLDTSNLTNRQQAAVENAKSFLQVDMANLSNEQQSGMFNMQQLTQSILTDQAALNASQQFNATSQNQVDQFFANLRSQVEQFNATQSNAQDQFNAGELNTLARFNAEVMNARDQFNAQNQIAIAQNNAVWRRELATADTAAINRANELNAKAVLDISNEAYDDLWAFYADTMEWAWKSAENEQDRINALGVANISKEAQAYTAEQTKKAAGSSAIGSMLGTLGAAVIRGPFS